MALRLPDEEQAGLTQLRPHQLALAFSFHMQKSSAQVRLSAIWVHRYYYPVFASLMPIIDCVSFGSCLFA
jgi:hypothetical protein